jgi:hypothetical protein
MALQAVPSPSVRLPVPAPPTRTTVESVENSEHDPADDTLIVATPSRGNPPHVLTVQDSKIGLVSAFQGTHLVSAAAYAAAAT